MNPTLFHPPSSDYLEEYFGPLEEHMACPEFWLPTPELAAPLLRELPSWNQRVLGHSLLGEEIIALEYGAEEPLEGITSTCLHSSLAVSIVPCDPTAIYPDSFYGTNFRERPVIVLQGGIHGGEISGTVAGLNLCAITETGCDLRGRPWPRLAELARQIRILFIPWLNPDGCNRFRTLNPSRISTDLYQAQVHGVSRDGKMRDYREQKAFWPVPFEEIGHLGGYFNQAGFNLNYDVFQIEPQPETRAWMRYYLDQRPDAVLAFHCNNGSIIGPSEYYLTPGHQHALSRIGGAVNAACRLRGLPAHRLSWADLPGNGKPFIDQSTAIYHVSGALPLLVEFPVGMEVCGSSLDQAVDIALTTFEEVFAYALTEGMRPYQYREKIVRRMQKS